MPVIMLTAKSAEDDRVKGLCIGADDYVIKPFSVRELVARVQAHLRRSKKDERKELSFNNGGLVIDTLAQEVKKNGRSFLLLPPSSGYSSVLPRGRISYSAASN